MDENTKQVVASNLTVALLSALNHNRPTGITTELFLVSDDKVLQIYRTFLDKLKQLNT